jgi:hypothetical protein
MIKIEFSEQDLKTIDYERFQRTFDTLLTGDQVNLFSNKPKLLSILTY